MKPTMTFVKLVVCCLIPIYLVAAAVSRVTLVPDTSLEFALVGIVAGWLLLAAFVQFGGTEKAERFDRAQHRFFTKALYRDKYVKAIKAGATEEEAHARAVDALRTANLRVSRRSRG